jgi:hypothetical protein
MHMHLKEPLIPPDHVNPSLSVGLGEVVEVMMAKDRNHRYASTKDLILDLEAVAVGQPPLQVRKVLDAEALTALTGPAPPGAADEAAGQPWMPSATLLYVVLLALVVSIVINFVLALR